MHANVVTLKLWWNYYCYFAAFWRRFMCSGSVWDLFKLLEKHFFLESVEDVDRRIMQKIHSGDFRKIIKLSAFCMVNDQMNFNRKKTIKKSIDTFVTYNNLFTVVTKISNSTGDFICLWQGEVLSSVSVLCIS